MSIDFQIRSKSGDGEERGGFQVELTYNETSSETTWFMFQCSRRFPSLVMNTNSNNDFASVIVSDDEEIRQPSAAR